MFLWVHGLHAVLWNSCFTLWRVSSVGINWIFTWSCLGLRPERLFFETTTAGISLNYVLSDLFLNIITVIGHKISCFKSAVTTPRPHHKHSKKVNDGVWRRSCGCLKGGVSQIFCHKSWRSKPQRVRLQNGVQNKTQQYVNSAMQCLVRRLEPCDTDRYLANIRHILAT